MGENMNDFSKNYEDLTFTDNFIFSKIMQNEKICKGVIERLLHIKVSKIVYHEIEKSVKPTLEQHGVRFDVYLEDTNTIYDIEMQNYYINDIGKRCRFYQSTIDVDNLAQGTDYENLKASYIVFLCGFDPFKKGLPTYSFTHRAKENPEIELGDKCSCIVYNYKQAEKEDDPEIRDFLNFLATNDAGTDFTQEIKNMVTTDITEKRYFREYMTRRLAERDMQKVGHDRGFIEGEKAGKLDAARNMLADGLAIQSIAKYTGLTFEEIQTLNN